MEKTNKILLNMLGLPIIQSVDDLSELTHLSKYTIYQLSYHSEKYYKCYEIKKKSGKPRLISQPSRKLKGLQAWILVFILNKLKVSTSCKGFEKGSSIADNARPHIEANTVLTMDIKDFFPSINRKKVYNVFKSLGYNKNISTILTNICIYKDSLPQGSPCSPKLANLVSWRLDVRIQGYVGIRGITYTRYADDMTFSGLNPQNIVKIIPRIKEIILDESFHVNNQKTRIAGAARAKIVTGLVLSKDSFGVGKKKYKQIRAKIHHLTISKEQKNFKLLNEVKGWLAYLKSVDDTRFIKSKIYIKKLIDKHPDTLVTELKIK
jgi:retron-type reverse transcriptase